jgi:DNA-binding protein YbaB
MVSLSIDEALFKEGDAETLADLILAAHADAKSKLDAASQTLMQGAMGPLAGLAGGFPGLKP